MSHAVIHADALTYLRGNRWLVQNGYIPKAHAILCDPPYGLEFMGKEWDRPKPSGLMATRDPRDPRDPKHNPTGKASSPFLAAAVNKYVAGEDFQAWVTEWAGLLLDYVYPGALGLFFGGTRTYHRLAAGLEDAGWEIADSLMWVYGSGFPKSASISKLLDKEAGAVREVVGGVQRKPFGYEDRPWKHAEDAYTSPITAPATPLAARWEGYGTALKPSWESVVVARAPRGKHTYAALARTFGTGAINVDGGRIPSNGDVIRSSHNVTIGGNGIYQGGRAFETGAIDGRRWPANFGLICACESDEHDDDCPVAVLGEQSGVTGTGTFKPRSNNRTAIQFSPDNGWNSHSMNPNNANAPDDYGDVGTAARFFYQAKAAAWEREAGLYTTEHVEYNKAINHGGSTWESTARNQSIPAALDTPQRRVITDFRYGTARRSPYVSCWPITGYGSRNTARSRKGIKYITGTGTNKTIVLKILSLSILPLTSASIADANSVMASGGNHARSAESSNPSMPSIGISAKRDGPNTVNADLAISRGSSKENRTAEIESGRKNRHPTIKPIRLAAYLATLLLPPELDEPRRLLVPFAGSGSEMIGALLAGWDVVTGIEREAEYVELAEARVGWWAQFASYDDARAAYEKERKAKPALVVIEDKPEQIALFPADEEAS